MMIFLALVLGFGNVALLGVILPSLWLWFMVPFGVPPFLGFWHAVGFGLLFNFLTFRIPIADIMAEKSLEKSEKEMLAVAKQVGNTVVMLSAWGFGYLYMLLM